ncbi:nucleoside 2-deoxyribosyltransferase [Levilactobacillus suantsaii]|uniref:Nucleoside 2-deoxyribosyltransferase n=1 Tax=Levilactobacillus suantsaii TaxID=2292255 RepID=A0A4Q0VHB0_9LACO|nr:nucleoside 2-deoxyribosyltransferase [Levilactobacillus suantsaii]QMU09032.1 nucleoside 2-deoxyribosyltransferase [Levilactobacillus suantsaii]RXI76466.1 nucleoside 2-deoxyribosyltransferase [Levilactobacillus suantsaii]
MAQIYVASPFFSPEQVDRVTRLEQALAANPTVTDFYSPRLHQDAQAEQFTKTWATEIFHRDMSQIEAADVIVTVLDFEAKNLDSGTAYELGVATMRNQPILALQEKDEAVNLMITECLHWYTKQVTDFATYDFKTLPKGEFVGQIL